MEKFGNRTQIHNTGILYSNQVDIVRTSYAHVEANNLLHILKSEQ